MLSHCHIPHLYAFEFSLFPWKRDSLRGSHGEALKKFRVEKNEVFSYRVLSDLEKNRFGEKCFEEHIMKNFDAKSAVTGDLCDVDRWGWRREEQ